jgi:hypothetical protein
MIKVTGQMDQICQTSRCISLTVLYVIENLAAQVVCPENWILE